MATLKFYPIPATGGDATNPSAVSLSIAATTASAYQSIGHNQFVRIVANGGVNIRFGNSNTATATASDLYLPAGVVEYFDMGRFNEGFVVYNPAATTTNVWYSIICKT